MDTLIVVADLGGFKVYRFSLDDLDGTTSMKLVVEVKNQSGHSRQGDRVTDQAGRFPKGASGAAGGMGFGENHNEKSESRRKSLEALAASLEAVLKKESDYDFWDLAAPKTINQQLLDLMDAGLRKQVKKNLALDLMKSGKKDLVERFGLS
jgi:hypothetical protein